MIEQVWSTLQPGVNTYKNFTYLGRFPVEPIVDDFNIEMQRGSFFGILSEETVKLIEGWAGDLVVTKSTFRSLDISVRKMDEKPCYDFLDCPYWEQAKKQLYKDYGPKLILDGQSLTIDETIGSMDMSKAVGFIEGKAGYRKKSQWFAAGHLGEIFDDDVLAEIPVWKVVGKVETRPRKVYVLEEKQRTFVIEPVVPLFHRKRIYGGQNRALKNFKSSAYGFNPYEGGTDAMARKLIKHKRFWEWDAKKWDRKASWMRTIYDFRNSLLPYDKFKTWVTNSGIESTLVLPNGDVVWKDWGNNSGSGNTTTDNILGMIVITYLAITILFPDNPEYLEDKWLTFFAFGDDVIGADSLPCTDEQFIYAVEKAFALFGVELEPFIVDHKLHGHTFLGFTFVEIQEGWIPAYNLETIAKSFLYKAHNMREEGEITKLISLMLMSAGHGKEIYDTFRSAVVEVVFNTQSEFVKAIRKSGVPGYYDVIDWYLGYESKNSEVNFIFFKDLLKDFCGE